ncbi:DUF2200 family protein [Tabrizicola flagellatus]|uniref:DUF2200 family protein n=1 Tax=Tabrizicola flagellatus TaxID=2593021 RepID=UPI00190F4A70|nr:DUF2200 family protein [Tabrizicola flagellatus]
MTQRVHAMSVAKVYPLYLAKVERTGRTRAELDAVIFWLTARRPTASLLALAHPATRRRRRSRSR